MKESDVGSDGPISPPSYVFRILPASVEWSHMLKCQCFLGSPNVYIRPGVTGQNLSVPGRICVAKTNSVLIGHQESQWRSVQDHEAHPAIH